jgi:uncharacterized DUF497 family protein
MNTGNELDRFDWDAEKRRSNAQKHGIDFIDAARCLKEGPRLDLESNRGGEFRTLAICPMNAKLIAVVFTMRGEICRIISARAARDDEQRKYRQLYD